jgi:hypothetical protein
MLVAVNVDEADDPHHRENAPVLAEWQSIQIVE